MKTQIRSRALEVNLAQTREVEINIPEDHQWFIHCSRDYIGIHKRGLDFFTELHHPFSNRSFIVDQMPGLFLSDFWFYQSLHESEKAFMIMSDVAGKLLQESLPEKLAGKMIYTFLKFIELMSAEPEKNHLPLTMALTQLEDGLEPVPMAYMINLGLFFSALKPLAIRKETNQRVFDLTRILIRKNLDFWQSTTKIEAWYQSKEKIFGDRYLQKIEALGTPFFREQYRKLEDATDWEKLTGTSFTFTDIAVAFRRFTETLDRAIERLHYLFLLLHLPGMDHQRDYLLWDLNKAIRDIRKELTEEEILTSIDELFELFDEFREHHVGTVLDSVLTLGKEIMNSTNLRLIHHFEERLIRMGFVTPGVIYLADNWQLHVDRNHVKCLRVWMELIEYSPEVMKKLLSALILNLRLGGIFIFDNDLFQRDVSRLLNSEIAPIYKRIKQLTRIFPVYFNEIGAEGELRDVTTTVDELSQRADRLIHFLRKQIHTEGNNSHISITLEILKFWHSRDISGLKSIVPPDVLEMVDPEGPWVKGVHEVIVALCQSAALTVGQLSEIDITGLERMAEHLPADHETDIRRALLMVRLYKLLKEKYSFETINITGILSRYNFFTREEIAGLSDHLDAMQNEEALKIIFSFMNRLNQVIFDPAISQGWDNIYHKRHIAFGIPSMYGEYHEKKFEALGLTFRLEGIATILMERIISGLNTDYITARTLKNIYKILTMLSEGLELDGMQDQGFNSNLQMLQYSLTSGSFTIRQYLNIFQFMGESVREIIHHYFISPYDDLLKIITPQIFAEALSENGAKNNQFIHKHSEIFFRDLISSAFLIQELDNFISKVLGSLRNMADNFSGEDLRQIMSYDPDVMISPFHVPINSLDSQVFLGSKGYYLKALFGKGFPVPPGFILTTEMFRRKDAILKHPSLRTEVDNLISQQVRELEKITGRRYADPTNPLLLSVRSGSAISMPGAMNTFLNVGLNDEITEELSRQHNFGWTSWDCYRRLLQTWGMSYQIDRDVFDQIILDYKKVYNVTRKIDFPPAIMREIAFAYKKELTDRHIPFEPDPMKMLRQAIIAVFNSWDNARANVYRSHLQIAHEWGTAVIVQQMVFGNIHRNSGSGVVFTHDERDRMPGIHLTGDFSFLSQGEDIVAGLINTLPVSERQREKYYARCQMSLESEYPKIYNRLNQLAHELIEQHDFGHQEIEFTFETPEPEDLFILQVRDQTMAKPRKKTIFTTPAPEREKVGAGIGIGDQVLNGYIAFDMEDIRTINDKYGRGKCILVRPDTVPDDIEMIIESDGLLTGRGGATSHAAVTAASLGKVCVVNCTDLQMNDKEKTCLMTGHLFRAFDKIALDGTPGLIYKGHYPTRTEEF